MSGLKSVCEQSEQSDFSKITILTFRIKIEIVILAHLLASGLGGTGR